VLCLSETFSRLVFFKCLQSACLNFWYCMSFFRSCLCSEELGLFEPYERLNSFNLSQTLTMC